MEPNEKNGDYDLRIMRAILPNAEYDNAIDRPTVSIGTDILTLEYQSAFAGMPSRFIAAYMYGGRAGRGERRRVYPEPVKALRAVLQLADSEFQDEEEKLEILLANVKEKRSRIAGVISSLPE